MGGFLSREGGNEKPRVDFRQGHLLREDGSYQADYPTNIDQEIPDWIKIPLLGEAEPAVRLVIKFWFGGGA